MKSIELLKRELSFIESRILLIRQGKVKEVNGITLKEALEYKEDFKNAIEILEKSKNS